ncbi:polysaccharide deacetylase family protein [Ketobacter sp.]
MQKKPFRPTKQSDLRALVSIHDVMPETREQVTTMLLKLAQQAPQLTPPFITLLIVPGRQWSQSDLAWLHALAQAGHPLAGHGWSHKAPLKRTLYHLLHSLVLSRDAAEHLSRNHHELRQLVLDCFNWFHHYGLPRPSLYVPPAWAAGNLGIRQWKTLPFAQLETLAGVTDLQSGHKYKLPLTGYEADNAFRAISLRLFNCLNIKRARKSGAPLRIGLHPFDLDYRLAQNALSDLTLVDRFCQYSELH